MMEISLKYILCTYKLRENIAKDQQYKFNLHLNINSISLYSSIIVNYMPIKTILNIYITPNQYTAPTTRNLQYIGIYAYYTWSDERNIASMYPWRAATNEAIVI